MYTKRAISENYSFNLGGSPKKFLEIFLKISRIKKFPKICKIS